MTIPARNKNRRRRPRRRDEDDAAAVRRRSRQRRALLDEMDEGWEADLRHDDPWDDVSRDANVRDRLKDLLG